MLLQNSKSVSLLCLIIVFIQAFEFYNKALSLVQTDTSLHSIKNNLLFELSGAHLSLATLMQDNAPLQSMAEEKVLFFILTFSFSKTSIELPKLNI